jgi:hypothetical protein
MIRWRGGEGQLRVESGDSLAAPRPAAFGATSPLTVEPTRNGSPPYSTGAVGDRQGPLRGGVETFDQRITGRAGPAEENGKDATPCFSLETQTAAPGIVGAR